MAVPRRGGAPSTNAHGSRRPARLATAPPLAAMPQCGIASARLRSVPAIVFGLATAVLWATTLLASARPSRLLGPWSTLAWVMLIGLVVTLPFVVATAPSVALTQEDLALMATAGVANSVGLLCNYAAVRRGKVAVVGPIVSTEGAIAAVLAVVAGDPLSGAAAAVLVLIAVGVVLASIEGSAGDRSEEHTSELQSHSDLV